MAKASQEAVDKLNDDLYKLQTKLDALLTKLGLSYVEDSWCMVDSKKLHALIKENSK